MGDLFGVTPSQADPKTTKVVIGNAPISSEIARQTCIVSCVAFIATFDVSLVKSAFFIRMSTWLMATTKHKKWKTRDLVLRSVCLAGSSIPSPQGGKPFLRLEFARTQNFLALGSPRTSHAVSRDVTPSFLCPSTSQVRTLAVPHFAFRRQLICHYIYRTVASFRVSSGSTCDIFRSFH